MATASAAMLGGVEPDVPVGRPRMNAWAEASNEGLELCGAAIRADAYGYACLGDPARAADLAWRDSGMTHRRTGIYGAMFIAAAIAAAPFARDPSISSPPPCATCRVAVGFSVSFRTA